ncbi:MAG: carboxymuconolactone decarboxylase family protein [Chloroflexi bacterium]|nr:carboxymuconolactone decarboxylase family protein [Chloroflexota bacterium]
MPNVQPLNREDLAEFEPVFQLAEATMGFVPRSMLTMGRRPDILRNFAALTITVMGGGTVNRDLKQLIAMIASVSAGCRYCQAHTGASAARAGASLEKVEAVFDFETSPLFDDAERAALRIARDAGLVPNATTPEHFTDLRQHFNDEEIVEIVATVSLFGWLNRWNDTMATELEEEPTIFASGALAGHGWEAGKHGGE